MEITFTVDASALNRAIGIASIVAPQVTPQTGGGYLMMVRRDTCDVYSRDGKHEARSSFPIFDVTGEGAFILPSEAIKGLGHISGSINFKATEENGACKVKYTFGESGSNERVSFDPRSTHMFERDIAAAQESVPPKEFSIKILQFGLGLAKSFLPKSGDVLDQDVFKTIRIFGNADPELARANGYMLASNSKEICYVQCPAFMDKDLSLPAQHLGLIESFLGRSTGNVSTYQTDTKVYMINGRGDVLGWPRHTIEYKKFSYYAKTDEVVVRVARDQIGSQLKYMRDSLAKDKDKTKTKIRMHFDPATGVIRLSSAEESNTLSSDPVPTEKIEVKVSEPLAMNVNVNQMLHLFEGIRGDKVEFRIKVIPADERRPKDRFMFRTIDGFLLSEDGVVVGGLSDNPPADTEYPPKGAYECRVTRFAPGID
jgi:hypothetical protein